MHYVYALCTCEYNSRGVYREKKKSKFKFVS